MNAYTSKDELALLGSSNVSHPQHIADANSRHVGLVAAIAGRVRGYLARQRTLSELHSLTDRELADIGLHRAQLNDVFSPNFAGAR